MTSSSKLKEQDFFSSQDKPLPVQCLVEIEIITWTLLSEVDSLTLLALHFFHWRITTILFPLKNEKLSLFSVLGTFTEYIWISLLWLCYSEIADDTCLPLTFNGILVLLWEAIILAVWKCLMRHQGPVMHFPAISPTLFLSLFLLFYFQHLKKGEWGFKNTVYDTLCLEELTERYKVSKLRDAAILPQAALQKWRNRIARGLLSSQTAAVQQCCLKMSSPAAKTRSVFRQAW